MVSLQFRLPLAALLGSFSLLSIGVNAQHHFETFEDRWIIDISFDGETVLLSRGTIWTPDEGIVHQYPQVDGRSYRGLAPDGSYVAFHVWEQHPYYNSTVGVAFLAYPDGREIEWMRASYRERAPSFGGHGIWPMWTYYFGGRRVVTEAGSVSGGSWDESLPVPLISPDGHTYYGIDSGRLQIGTRSEGVRTIPDEYPGMQVEGSSHDGTYIVGTYLVPGERDHRFWLYTEGVGITTLPGKRPLNSVSSPSVPSYSHISADGSMVQVGDYYWLDGELHTFAETAALAGASVDVSESYYFLISDDGRVLATERWYLRLGEEDTSDLTPLHLGTGHAQFARYEGIFGSSLTDLYAAESFPDSPDSIEAFTRFEFTGSGNNFGVHAWAWILPETTGDYTFWIASDDEGVLSFSPDADSAKAEIIALVPEDTRRREFDRHLEQKSAVIHLEAGKVYYIEAQMKQGWSNVHLSVAWQGPGFARQVIPGRNLGLPFDDGGTVPHPVFIDRKAILAFYDRIPGATLDVLYDNGFFPDNPHRILEFGLFTGNLPSLSTRLIGDNFGLYAWTWFVPPATGPYTFWLSSDDQGELWLSENAEPAGAQLIANVSSHTRFQEYWFPEQQSSPVHLNAGSPYFLSTIVKQGWSESHFSILLKYPNGQYRMLETSRITTTPGSTAWGPGGPPVESLDTGVMAMAQYDNIAGNTLNGLRVASKFPEAPDKLFVSLNASRHPNVESNFGLFAWGWLIPEVSGDYRFWLLSDNQGELYLSPNAAPSRARLIANVETFVAPHQFEKFPSQQSEWITLEAGRPYYFAGLVKQGWGSSLFAVYWEGPGIPRQVIPGRVIGLPAPNGFAVPEP